MRHKREKQIIKNKTKRGFETRKQRKNKKQRVKLSLTAAKAIHGEDKDFLRHSTTQRTNGVSRDYLSLQLYEVSFEFGPLELDRHDVVYKALRCVCEKMGEIPPGLEKPEHVFHIYAPTGSSIRQICLGVFNSDPTTRKLKVGVEMSEHTISIVHLDMKSLHNEKTLSSVCNLLEYNAKNPLIYVLCNTHLNGDSESFIKTGIKASNIIVDASDISLIYEKCYDLLGDKTASLLSKLMKMHKKKPNSADGFMKIVTDLQTKLKNRSKNKNMQLPESCIKTLQISCSSKHGIIGYMKTVDALILIVNECHKRKQSMISTLKNRLLKEMPNLVVHCLVFRPQIQISPGEKVYRTRKLSCFGTLGIFGSLQGKGVAITGAHVISAKSPAYIFSENTFVKIGECIWPDPVKDKTDIFNISVIPVDDDAQGRLELCDGVDEVHIYNETLSSLQNRKVFKIGGETGRTIGRIKEAELGFEEGEDAVLVIPEPGNEEGIFSREGDSGSIVFTKLGTNLFALGVVFAGQVDLFETDTPELSTLVVNFKNALQKFSISNGILTLKKI